MSKKVKILRNFTFAEMAQEDPEVKAWFNGAFRAVGPYWEGKTPGSGLSFAEQKLLLPSVLGMESNDKDFRKSVERYYHELMTRIPALGLELEIGLDNDSEPLGEINLPLNIKEYVLFRHISGSKQVAKNKDEADKYGQLKPFYIEDFSAVVNENIAMSKLEDRAFTMYLNTKDDQIKVDQILTMMAVTIRGMTPHDKQLKFKSLATKDPHKSPYQQKEAFERFMELCEDKDLPVKFLIQELVGAQVLEKVGSNILLKETGALLGENMKDAVMFLNNAKNSKTLNILKAEYQAKVKKDIKLAPETIKE